MLDSIFAFFSRALRALGSAFSALLAFLARPFAASGRWYARRGWLIKAPIGILLLLLVGFYGYFIWNTQVWNGFDPDYVQAYELANRNISAGEQISAAGGPDEARICGRSALADITAGLIDMNVDENAWISSMLLYKLGLFGMDWDRTPFLDNKASFQRGVNQAIRRTTVEMVDTLGRVRGTSQIDQNLQNARGSMQFDEETWYFGLNPFGPKTPTPSFYRSAARNLRAFNDRLEACNAVFDARADNLITFIDRITNDMGATSAILRERSENHNGGWFDTRADDRFWFAYGQLYGYYGVLHAVAADFEDVIRQRSIGPLWLRVEEQFRAALNIRPFIVSNGKEAGWIMPTHLATMGFYVLGARSNLVEVRSVLDR